MDKGGATSRRENGGGQAGFGAIGDIASPIGLRKHAPQLVLRLVSHRLGVTGRSGDLFGGAFGAGEEGAGRASDVDRLGLRRDQRLDSELHGGDGVGMI